MTGTTGVTVPADAVWRRGDGAEYVTTAAVTLVAGTAVAAVEGARKRP